MKKVGSRYEIISGKVLTFNYQSAGGPGEFVSGSVTFNFGNMDLISIESITVVK